jgi:hypothetical protein
MVATVPRDNGIYEWILLIVKNLRITSVDDNIWRKALKHVADLFSTHPILLVPSFSSFSIQSTGHFSQSPRLSNPSGMWNQASVPKGKLDETVTTGRSSS